MTATPPPPGPDLSTHTARPLIIGYVVKRYPRFSETFIVNEILALEAAGHRVEIFSLFPPNDTHFQDALSRVRAPVTYLPGEGIRAADFWTELERTARQIDGFWPILQDAAGYVARDVYQSTCLARLVTARKIDHLHAHFATSAASIARLAARFARISYSFTAHAKDIFHETVDEADLRRKLSDASSVVTVSNFNVRFLKQKFGEDASKVRRVYNGLDLHQFKYQAPLDRPARIVSVGRLVEKKGFDVLIDACAHLRDQGSRFECDIIGSGEQEQVLLDRIRNHGLNSRVRLLGSRPQSEVIRRISSSALFAAPCVIGSDGNADGLPTVLLEAMALGTPCVSTDVTGIPELIRHEETGLLVPQHDPLRLAEAMIRLLQESALRVQLATAARRLIEDEFDIVRNARAIFLTFEAAVSKRLPTRVPLHPTSELQATAVSQDHK